MNIGFNGFGDNTVTFEADSTVKKGTLVKLIEDNTVSACASGDKAVGVCVNEREGYAAVKLHGYTELASEGEIQLGYQTLTAASATAVKADAAGREYLVVSSGNGSAGIIL